LGSRERLSSDVLRLQSSTLHLKTLSNRVHHRQNASKMFSVPGWSSEAITLFLNNVAACFLLTIDRTFGCVLLDSTHGVPAVTRPIWHTKKETMNATAVEKTTPLQNEATGVAQAVAGKSGSLASAAN